MTIRDSLLPCSTSIIQGNNGGPHCDHTFFGKEVGENQPLCNAYNNSHKSNYDKNRTNKKVMVINYSLMDNNENSGKK
jgi:hypothetical protein